jgi:hypothetical protein
MTTEEIHANHARREAERQGRSRQRQRHRSGTVQILKWQ